MYKLLFCLFFIVSCQRSNFSSVDDYVFGMTGGTLFSDPIMVSSNIHLDSVLNRAGCCFSGESSLRVISKLILFLTMTLEG